MRVDPSALGRTCGTTSGGLARSLRRCVRRSTRDSSRSRLPSRETRSIRLRAAAPARALEEARLPPPPCCFTSEMKAARGLPARDDVDGRALAYASTKMSRDPAEAVCRGSPRSRSTERLQELLTHSSTATLAKRRSPESRFRSWKRIAMASDIRDGVAGGEAGMSHVALTRQSACRGARSCDAGLKPWPTLCELAIRCRAEALPHCVRALVD